MKTAKENIETLFSQHQGYLQSKLLNKSGSLYLALKKLLGNGLVIKIKPGLYKHKSYGSNNEWLDICKMYPDGVLCMHSAWHYYELSTYIPNTIHLAFEHKSKIKINDYPPIQAYYWSKPYYNLEVEMKEGIKIYSLEKIICDAIKFRNKIGKDTMAEVLKNYLRRKDKDLNTLFRIAKIMKMENLLREYLNLIQ